MLELGARQPYNQGIVLVTEARFKITVVELVTSKLIVQLRVKYNLQKS